MLVNDYSCRGRRLEEADCFYDSEVNNEIRRLLYEANQVILCDPSDV